MILKFLLIFFIFWLLWSYLFVPTVKINKPNAVVNQNPDKNALCKSICRENPNEHVICNCEEIF